MIKILSSLFISTLSLNAYAHLELGTYTGSDRGGESCSFKVTEITFQEGRKNPLNERVQIRYENREYTLAHMPIIQEDIFTVLPNKDFLTGARGTDDFNEAFMLKMEHSENNNGPSQFTFVRHYPDFPGMSNRYICSDLKMTSH